MTLSHEEKTAPDSSALTAASMVLNQDQQNAITEILTFLVSDEREYSLSGAAGTGKTFVMLYVINRLLDDYAVMCGLLNVPHRAFQIALTATTNKAAEVLTQTTGKLASTIHSFLGLKLIEDYDTGATSCKPDPRNQKTIVDTLLFIDEASMINEELHGYITRLVGEGCKIIYLGDRYQMAPVREEVSPVYSVPKRESELLQPMRNGHNQALVALSAQLRQTVKDGVFHPIHGHPGSIDYLTAENAEQAVRHVFSQERPDARILCYTNDRVQQFNDFIRHLRGYQRMFQPGETVINAKVLDIKTKLLRVEEEFIVKEVYPDLFPIQIDDANPESVMDVYRIELAKPDQELVHYTVNVPANPAQYRAILRYYAEKKNWPCYFKAKEIAADLRPRDASTVYKAQGSTYDTVFLDLTNITACHSNDQIARMLYVGVTRARNRIFLMGHMNPRLFRR